MIRRRLLQFGSTIVFAGCATSFEPKPLPSSHPANAQAAEAPRSRSTRLLARDELTTKTNAQLATKEVPNPDFQSTDMSDEMQGMEGMRHANQPKPAQSASQSKAGRQSYWTCVMHPEIHQDKPGNCPKCGMTLVKKQGASQ